MRIALYAHKWHYIDNYEPFIEELKNRGVDFVVIIIYPRDDSYHKYKQKYGNRLKEPYYEKYGNFFYQPRYMPIFLRNLTKVLFFKFKLKKFLSRGNYDILVSSDDRALLPCAVLSAAKDLNLKTIIYPSETILLVESFIADRVAALPSPTLKRMAVSFISKKIYPANTIRYENKDLHHTHPRQVIELFFLKLFPKNPWISGTNPNSDISAVSSHFQKDEDIANGGSKEKIHITGFPPHDMLHSMLQNRNRERAKICDTFGIADKKLFLIVGTHYISPTYIDDSDMLRFDAEVNDMLEVIYSMLGNEYEIILKVHPQRNIEEQKNKIKKDLRDRIIFVKNEYSAYQLTAVSDVILNFMSSATIAAFATDVPVFCYYLVRKSLATSDWTKKYRSISQVSSPAELKAALQDMKVNKELREIDRNRYGKFDGKNTQRFFLATKSMFEDSIFSERKS